MENPASEATTPEEVPPRPERLVSIDALRGFDMFWIVGGDELARALCKWWGTPAAAQFGEQFEHVEWEGFRFYDLIFPLFLFLVGVVVPFSLSKYQSGAHPRAHAVGRIARRVAVLLLLGLIYNGLLQFRFPMRMTGVLQRIAIGYGMAAMIYLFTKARTQAILIGAILVGYWAVLMFVPAPETGRAGDFAKETNLAGYIDRHYLPGKIFQSFYGYGDNEGLLSTIPAIATALLGVLSGQLLMTGRYSPWAKVGILLAAGAACLGVGTAWGYQFPVIKILWTSSYVLVVGGWSLILLGLFYAIVDVLRVRFWAWFFVVIGVNAITIYMLSRILPFDDLAKFFFGGLARISEQHAPLTQPVILAAGSLLLEWLLLLYFYRRRIFLRV